MRHSWPCLSDLWDSQSNANPITVLCKEGKYLFVLYLDSVVFGYGWIPYTKFLKFSDKDWILISKIFSVMDQELKNQYLLTSARQYIK